MKTAEMVRVEVFMETGYVGKTLRFSSIPSVQDIVDAIHHTVESVEWLPPTGKMSDFARPCPDIEMTYCRAVRDGKYRMFRETLFDINK